MASSLQRHDAGYMTAAAALISLAIAVIVSAVLTLSLTQLRRSRAALERTQVAALLDGGQLLAGITVGSNIKGGRIRWRETTSIGEFDILAEPEREKLSAEGVIDPALLIRLGANDASTAALWLASEARRSTPGPVADAETSALWRACAPSMISYFGQAVEPKLLAAGEPDRQGMRAVAGQVWRIRVGARGWVDDRLVRMTGDDRRPAITITRRFAKEQSGAEPCGAFIEAQ